MDNEKVVLNWQRKIIAECESRLGRKLTASEEHFICSRGGFLALEMIEDTVMSLTGDELVAYLNSEV
jgi:hypothetical protein